jgi:hypothetical protein
MPFVSSITDQVRSAISALQAIELTISYFYVIVYTLVLVLCMLFNTKRGLIVVSCILAFYLGVVQGYPHIASSVHLHPALWLIYLPAGLIFLVSLGVSMFMDR